MTTVNSSLRPKRLQGKKTATLKDCKTCCLEEMTFLINKQAQREGVPHKFPRDPPSFDQFACLILTTVANLASSGQANIMGYQVTAN